MAGESGSDLAWNGTAIASWPREQRCRPPDAESGCRFLLTEDGPGRRRCGARCLAGTAYCRRHHALCAVAPDSPEGGRVARAFERAAAAAIPPPDELGFLASVAVPELEGNELGDIVACLDFAPMRDRDSDEA